MRQTEWACLQNQYNTLSTINKTNWFYCNNSKGSGHVCKTDTGNHKQLLKPIGFTYTNEQLLKPIGFTCKNDKRSGHVCKFATIRLLKQIFVHAKNDKRSGHACKLDTRNHQYLLKPIGFTCQTDKRIGHVCKTDTMNHQQC